MRLFSYLFLTIRGQFSRLSSCHVIGRNPGRRSSNERPRVLAAGGRGLASPDSKGATASSSGRPRLLAPPSTGRRPGAASAAARLQCPPEPLLGAGSSAATHAGQRARGRLAPPAATTGLSSPSRRPARRVTMEEKKGGEGADTEEPATGLPHLPSSRLASRQTTAPQAGADPPRAAARAAHAPMAALCESRPPGLLPCRLCGETGRESASGDNERECCVGEI